MTIADSPNTVISPDPQTPETLIEYYKSVRAFTERMCEPMVNEDYVIQSMPDVSPTKWHQISAKEDLQCQTNHLRLI